jgi:hypothetical protein
MNPRHAEAAEAFSADNPHIYIALRDLAFKLLVAGHRRWGAKALWETLRYEFAISTDAHVRDYVLNNNYTAWYARQLMANEPELADFFEIRERQPNPTEL